MLSIITDLLIIIAPTSFIKSINHTIAIQHQTTRITHYNTYRIVDSILPVSHPITQG